MSRVNTKGIFFYFNQNILERIALNLNQIKGYKFSKNQIRESFDSFEISVSFFDSYYSYQGKMGYELARAIGVFHDDHHILDAIESYNEEEQRRRIQERHRARARGLSGW